ncbi:PTS sugar transporter subunit IIA [Piscinibacter sakaiensis]|uniref:PTS IIA-like nitrogen-regulatory protein PtsN n=1 Tax=Piscinibacter sakaiensis TaxID=1547922 RepID=A0A0K8P955_PISS1|nr:PTS sugar transporter subunit IIA [Piscinibacter sakaiensis]GAP38720.1 PTS IIA-like nitrogen-regulatory protein PtsN [Piscinibacter sakaiensis]
MDSLRPPTSRPRRVPALRTGTARPVLRGLPTLHPGLRPEPAPAPAGLDTALAVDAADPDALFAFAAERMAGGRVRVAEDYARRLAARHTRRSTALGHGLALPHAASGYANGVQALYLRTRAPLDFDAPDGEPVSDFLFLVVPRPASSAHSELLEALQEAFGLPRLRRELRQERPEAVLAELWQRVRRR